MSTHNIGFYEAILMSTHNIGFYEAILMSTHNIGFYEEISKYPLIFIKKLSNTHLISSSESSWGGPVTLTVTFIGNLLSSPKARLITFL